MLNIDIIKKEEVISQLEQQLIALRAELDVKKQTDSFSIYANQLLLRFVDRKYLLSLDYTIATGASVVEIELFGVKGNYIAKFTIETDRNCQGFITQAKVSAKEGKLNLTKGDPLLANELNTSKAFCERECVMAELASWVANACSSLQN